MVFFVASALISILVAGCATTARVKWQPVDATIKVGTVMVDPQVKAVVATGFVNQVEGAVELLACGPGGKRHESVLVIESDIIDLQSALLLAGAKAGEPMPELGQGPPHGSRVAVWVEWQSATGVVRIAAGHLLRRAGTDQSLERDPWVFTGSVVQEGAFKALAEESIIASYWDPWAVINIASQIGGDDEALLANEKAGIPLHEPVRIIIRVLDAAL